MTETNTNTGQKKTTTKKRASKPKPPTPPVETLDTPTKKTEKVFEPFTLVRCKSVRQNDLVYTATTGAKYTWMGFGDIREIPYQDIISLKARRSKFLYEPWMIIEDEDLMQKPEFKRDFEELYAFYKEFDNPRAFFERPIEEIKAKLKTAPNGLKDLIIYNAGEYINSGVLNRLDVINTIDEFFGTKLRMLIY